MTETRTAAQIAREKGRPMPLRTKVGQHRPIPEAIRRAQRAADDDPAAYPPSTPSKLRISRSASL